MSTASADETLRKDEAAEEAKKKSQIRALLRHGFLNICVRDVTIQAEVALFQKICHGNPAEAAKRMGIAQSLVGVGEFLLNPIAGRVSDAYGRRFFMVLGSLYACIGNLVVATWPTATLPGGMPVVIVNRAINNTLLTIAGSVTTSTAMSDLRAGDGLTVELAALFSTFGLGSIFGPWIGANLLARTGDFRRCYQMRSAIAALHVVHNLLTMPETLPAAKRVAFSVSGLNPFGFLKLVRASNHLQCLVAMSTFMSCCEMKNIIDFKNLWLKNDVGLDVLAVNRVQMAYGGLLFLSGKFFAPYVIKRFGGDFFTSIACWANATAFALMGMVAKPWAVWLGLVLHSPGINATGALATKAATIDLAIQEGFGKGELNSFVANLRALTVVVVPVLYGRAYASFSSARSGFGGRAWFLLLMLSSLLPETLHLFIGSLKPRTAL